VNKAHLAMALPQDVTYSGFKELICPYHLVTELQMGGTEVSAELQTLVEQAVKDIKKSKGAEKRAMRLNCDELALLLDDASTKASVIRQPTGKILKCVKSKQQKNFVFSYICCGDDDVVGSKSCTYYCHTMKCKNLQAQEDIVHAVKHNCRTIRLKRDSFTKDGRHVGELNGELLDNAIAWWNACKQPMFHYRLTKGGSNNAISGIIRARCEAGAGLDKKVRLDSEVRGLGLVELLAEKFNMGDINLNEWAVMFKTANEEEILDDDSNPIEHSLGWNDPSDGDFILKRLPKGFARVGGGGGDAFKTSAANDPRSPAAQGPRSPGSPTGSVGMNQGLGPMLPYNEEDEDLLLSVMITRQSGSGLGFKLTPAYLLQMCTTFCFLNKEEESLRRLLGKIGDLIAKTVSTNAANPAILLFWASNTMKLVAGFSTDERLLGIYKDTVAASLDATVNNSLDAIMQCKRDNVILPSELSAPAFESPAELRGVIVKHYEALDATMSRENLQEVVDRITAAMPTPKKVQPATPTDSNSSDPPPSFNLGGATVTSVETEPNTTPTTTTTSSGAAASSTPSGKGGGGGGDDGEQADESTEQGEGGGQHQERPGIDPLPEEWEELVDQETKHRFFANHLTRQTSWTDPRDKLTTVSLTKGATGLGLGISGAKRTWDDRLVLGIFVSSLVPNAAAAEDGSLHVGDEILEVQGHSLIGVSREYAIGFLKQIQLNDSVTLLVSQEPETWVNPAKEKAALRHTAL